MKMFCIFLSCFYFFFWELFVQTQSPLLDLFVCLILVYDFFVYLCIIIICQMYRWHRSHTPSVSFLFTQLVVSLAVQKPFGFMRSHLSILGLSSWANGDLFRKSFPSPMSCKVLFTYSSKIARLQAFTLRSWVHLGLVFV